MNSHQRRKVRRHIENNLYDTIYIWGKDKMGLYEYDLHPSNSKMLIEFYKNFATVRIPHPKLINLNISKFYQFVFVRNIERFENLNCFKLVWPSRDLNYFMFLGSFPKFKIETKKSFYLLSFKDVLGIGRNLEIVKYYYSSTFKDYQTLNKNISFEDILNDSDVSSNIKKEIIYNFNLF